MIYSHLLFYIIFGNNPTLLDISKYFFIKSKIFKWPKVIKTLQAVEACLFGQVQDSSIYKDVEVRARFLHYAYFIDHLNFYAAC